VGTTAELARFIAETHYDDLPAEVVAAAKVGILDGVANLLAGSTQPVAQLISAYTRELGGTPVSSVTGHGFKTNPLSARRCMTRGLLHVFPTPPNGRMSLARCVRRGRAGSMHGPVTMVMGGYETPPERLSVSQPIG
jgi:hypothetical protein